MYGCMYVDAPRALLQTCMHICNIHRYEHICAQQRHIYTLVYIQHACECMSALQYVVHPNTQV